MNDVYNVRKIPLSNNKERKISQLKYILGMELSLKEKILLGRDTTIKEINGYILKDYCCYRAVNTETYKKYLEMGYISSGIIDYEYEEYYLDNTLYNNNKGIDWYLGGVCLKYGEVILECPAYKKYFQVAFDNGNGMSKDPTVKFMKSSGYKNCIPIELVKVIHGLDLDNEINLKK